jgi:hypothetical protein
VDPHASFFQELLHFVIRILRSKREKKQDLVATGILGGTGILPVILGRLASRPYSLSYHSVLASDPTRYGCKTFENCFSFHCPIIQKIFMALNFPDEFDRMA